MIYKLDTFRINDGETKLRSRSIYPEYSDRQVCANSVDPDQTPQNAASDLVLNCLPFIQKFLDIPKGSKVEMFSFGTGVVRS